MKGVALFIDPGASTENVIETETSVIIRPDRGIDSITVLHGFLQNCGDCGKADEATRIPLEVPKEVWDKLSDSEKRWLSRIAGAGVRPLARGSGRDGDNRQDVGAHGGHVDGYGVAYVDAAKCSAPRDVKIVRSAETKKPVSRSAPVEVMRVIVPGSVVDAAEAEYARLVAESLQPTQLVAYRRLLDSLAIK